MQKGVRNVAVAGDTVYLRGGTYAFNGPGIIPVAGIYIEKRGISRQTDLLLGLPGEKPVLNFAKLTLSPTATCAGIRLDGASYLYFKGLEICYVPMPGTVSNNGLWANPGSYITLGEQMNFHHNSGPGLP